MMNSSWNVLFQWLARPPRWNIPRIIGGRLSQAFLDLGCSSLWCCQKRDVLRNLIPDSSNRAVQSLRRRECPDYALIRAFSSSAGCSSFYSKSCASLGETHGWGQCGIAESLTPFSNLMICVIALCACFYQVSMCICMCVLYLCVLVNLSLIPFCLGRFNNSLYGIQVPLCPSFQQNSPISWW